MTDIEWTYPGFYPTMSTLALCFEVWLCSGVVIGVAMGLLYVEVTYGAAHNHAIEYVEYT